MGMFSGFYLHFLWEAVTLSCILSCVLYYGILSYLCFSLVGSFSLGAAYAASVVLSSFLSLACMGIVPFSIFIVLPYFTVILYLWFLWEHSHSPSFPSL